MLAPPLHADRLHNLPVSLTPLVGRGAPLAALATLFRDGVRFVTLTGPGGAGKTRLALELARRLASNFPDGAWFVPLAALSDPALLPATIATALGLRETGSTGPAELLAGWLREREALLVLDNFEQILPAAEQVARLLGEAPGLRLLVTSRAPLRLSGEQEFPVPPLDVPSAPETLDLTQLAANPAVDLFVQRARAVRPELALDASNAAAIAQICARLDGLPLALELAAARLRSLPPQALAARLDRRLTTLSSGPRDAPARQRTLRDTIAWSYDLLDPADQALFRRLSVFVGSFSLPAAAAVAGLSEAETLDGLERLIDQSLVRSVAGTSDEPRYAMLETVCEYADECLTFYEEDQHAREAHANWYLVQAELLGAAVASPDEVTLVDRLNHDQSNLRAALTWRLEQGEHDPAQIELGLRTAIGLWAFWDVRVHLTEVRAWLDRLLERSTGCDPALRARGLMFAGNFATNQNDLETSGRLLDECIAHASSFNDRALLAWALIFRARNSRLRGQLAELASDAEAALTISRELNDRFGISVSLAHLGAFWTGMFDYVQAASYMDKSIVMLRENGDAISLASVLSHRAMIALELGDIDAAERAASESIRFGEQLGGNQLIDGLWLRALVALEQGDQQHARERMVTAITAARRIGLTLTPNHYEALAIVVAQYPQPALAARMLGFADVLRETTRIVPLRVEARNRKRLDTTLSTTLGEDRFEAERNAGRASSAEPLLAEEAEAFAAMIAKQYAASPAERTPADVLTPRELDVLRQIVAGRTNREIAETLFITQRTAATHVTNILTKLNLESRTAAAAWAVREGVV